MMPTTPEIPFPQLLDKPLNQIDQISKKLGTNIVKTVKTTDTIPRLTSLMDCFEIRTVPVLDHRGQLVKVISLVDVAKVLTPPNSKLPTKYLIERGFDLSQLFKANEDMRKKTVEEAFEAISQPEIPTVIDTEILTNSIQKLLEKDENNRRNQTLIILNDQKKVAGTLSYVDVLRIIRDASGINAFLNQKYTNDILNRNVVTHTENDCLQDAIFTLKYSSFTHIPITRLEAENLVLGIVDDVTVATFTHKLLFDYLIEYPLGQMMNKVSDKNTVDPNCSIRKLIGKDEFYNSDRLRGR